MPKHDSHGLAKPPHTFYLPGVEETPKKSGGMSGKGSEWGSWACPPDNFVK